jgi:electron transport complex protein RnfG
MADSQLKHTVITTLIMVLFAIVGTAILAYTYTTTKIPIEASEAEARRALFEQVLPASMYDNDLLKDEVRIEAGGLLGNATETEAHRARKSGQPSAVILEVTAPDGYSGDIKLLVAIGLDGTIVGVRVLAHKETPGLGDYIDIAHSNWIRNFDRQSLAKTADEQWKVKKDGGGFDYMAGATITPRAVVKAVHQALQYYHEHQDALFAQAAAGEK